MAYAVVADLQGLLGFAPANAQQLLDRASRDVDRAIKCARYAVNATTGLPTDPVVLAALKAATIEQAAYQLEVGNDRGLRRDTITGVPSGGGSAGGVNLSTNTPAYGGSTAGMALLGDQPAWILRQAGLLGQAPITFLGG